MADDEVTLAEPPIQLKDIGDMTDRELLEELVISMRTVGAALSSMQRMGPAGMMKAVMTGKFTL
jgi:hypothetical protein